MEDLQGRGKGAKAQEVIIQGQLKAVMQVIMVVMVQGLVHRAFSWLDKFSSTVFSQQAVVVFLVTNIQPMAKVSSCPDLQLHQDHVMPAMITPSSDLTVPA